MTFEEIKNKESQYVMQTYARYPLALKEGKGAKLYDFGGREYIDFSSGIGVSSLGYANEKWVKAVSDQASKLAHISNLFYTEPMVNLAERLCKITGADRVFLGNSGAEANEGAIKIARKYSFDKYGKDRTKIVTLQNSFHGRTVTTIAATGQDKMHNFFFPFTEGFSYVPANDFDALEKAISKETCAFFIELVQGEGGVMPLEPEYVKKARALCKEKDILFMVDEVQTGVGRTGSFYAFQQFGIVPDVVTSAKGLGGGLPIGAILTFGDCSKTLTSGTHGSTFGANPICCAGANAVLDVVADENFLADVQKKGQYLRDRLTAIGHEDFKGVRGLGLMLGIVSTEEKYKQLVGKFMEAGLICITAGHDTIRLLPPLTITYDEIDAGISVIKKVMLGE